MKQYELTYLTPQELTEEEVKNLQDKLASLIQEKKGSVIEFQKAYKRKLAYEIKKKDIAYVNTVIFQLETGDLESLKKSLKEEPRILRDLIVKYRPITQKEYSRGRSKSKSEAAPAEQKEEEGEEKPAKKENAKAELNKIEEKLDEILHNE